ncbi:MAG: DUF1232 domain-containing protein [Solobacterium sp.]|nr:DUF1232 domain-containing protein [Solobacterium sp.]
MANSVIDIDKAKEILDSGIDQATDVLKSNEQVSRVLEQVQAKVKEVPMLESAVKDFPVMVSMVKSYATKEYAAVSPKVVATIVSAFLYLVKRKDLIPDNLPILGQLDDIAVVVLALNFVQPEINAFREWKAAQVKETTEA